MSEFISFDGNGLPETVKETSIVEVKLRNNETLTGLARIYDWTKREFDASHDIVAYRLVDEEVEVL